MGFWVTTLIFLLAGFVASLFSLLCCNRGPSTNLKEKRGINDIEYCRGSIRCIELQFRIPFDLGYYSNGLLLDDVGNRLSCAAEATDQPYTKRRVNCCEILEHFL
uniref:Wall-associated receptor kinase galacturonan-binding domain-containing protein n=1 Tax=Oryza glaberrima TaxID=4538 RepID=I1PQI8_ORYGL